MNLERNQARHREKEKKIVSMITTEKRVLKLDFINSCEEVLFYAEDLKRILKKIDQNLIIQNLTQYDQKRKGFAKIAKHHLKMLYDYDAELLQELEKLNIL